MLAGVVCTMLVASQVPFLEGLFRDSRQPWAILAAAVLVCVLGAADDKWDLDWVTKLAGQVLVALLLAWQGVSLVTLPINGVTVLSGRSALILTVLVVVVAMLISTFVEGYRWSALAAAGAVLGMAGMLIALRAKTAPVQPSSAANPSR